MILDVDADEFNRFVPQDGDSITAGQVLQRYNNRVHISGAVFRPGTYSLVDGMKLIDLIQRAQGVTEDVFNNRGIVFRLGKDLTPTTLAFDVTDVLNRKKDIVLQREDSVVIQDLFSMREERYVRIMGEVQEQGMYPYSEGMTINDLIFQAGGLKEAASESFIEISRRHSYERAASLSNDLVELYQFDISRSLKLADDDARFVMEPFDYVYIRKAPSYFEQKTVTIEGEILYPGQYSIQSKTERISDLIRRAGGLTPHAYVDGATLFRKVDKADLDTTMLSNLVVDTLVEKATRQLSSGRVEIQLSEILKDTTSIYNYHLKEGDRILIPEVSEEVHVVGAILNPVGLAYERGKRANYYINRSGGFSDQANSRKVYVINSDGTTEVTKTFLFRRYPKVSPGCKIMVPEKPEKEGLPVSTWLAIASTFSSLAIAIAAIMP
jgi:protein involved in polysaccharide export with SLBB domain